MCTYRDTRSWNNAERITIDFPKYWESTRHTHTRARLPEGWWSSFHLICPFPCLLCSVRMCMYVSGVCVCVCACVCVTVAREGSWENHITPLAKPHGSTITAYFRKSLRSRLTRDPGVCVCVCASACVWRSVSRERERERVIWKAGTQAQDSFGLCHFPSFICTQSTTFKTFTGKSSGWKDNKMADGSLPSKLELRVTFPRVMHINLPLKRY